MLSYSYLSLLKFAQTKKLKLMYPQLILKALVKNVFINIGCNEEDSEQSADILIRAELRGINTHGVVRLKEYVNLWKNKRIKTSPKWNIVHETLSTALLDGDKGFGLIIAPKAMKIAIKKAKNVGTGWVAVRNSYHYGIAGYYAMMALEHDMIGISMTNANPLVAPTFSQKPLMGTNPIAVAIPAGEESPFVADFATAPISRGKLDILHAQGVEAPDRLVQDNLGKPSNNPNILSEQGAILPLGGDREHGSHKGYCMAAIVDILSAVLSGANFGPLVVPTLSYLKKSDNRVDKGIGHFFGAMRIDAFQTAKEFKSQMDQWIRTFRKAIPVKGQERVLIPGDPERESEKIRITEGINISEEVAKDLQKIGNELGVHFNLEQLYQ